MGLREQRGWLHVGQLCWCSQFSCVGGLYFRDLLWLWVLQEGHLMELFLLAVHTELEPASILYITAFVLLCMHFKKPSVRMEFVSFLLVVRASSGGLGFLHWHHWVTHWVLFISVLRSLNCCVLVPRLTLIWLY